MEYHSMSVGWKLLASQECTWAVTISFSLTEQNRHVTSNFYIRNTMLECTLDLDQEKSGGTRCASFSEFSLSRLPDITIEILIMLSLLK